MTVTIDSDYIQRTLTEMVQIDSVNPDLVPGAAGEDDLAHYIAQEMETMGVDVEVHEIEPGRSNVAGRINGRGAGKSLMWNAHTDTVGVEGMAEPFSGAVRDGRLYGRGAYDMKASIAASLAVLRAFVKQDVIPAGDVLFTAVIDEEYGSKGMEDVVQRYQTDAAIVTEPTQLDVCRAHRGFLWLEVITTGRAAHGSLHEEGIDANMKMAKALVALDEYARSLLTQEPHPLLGTPALHAPLIKGGTSQSVYAAQCRTELERRTLPGEDSAAIVSEMQAILDELAADDPQFNATVRAFFERPPYEISEDASIVQTILSATRQVRGTDPAIYGAPWWMDSALLAAAGMETVIIGPSGGGIHADEEWVDLESVTDLAYILAQATLDFCGTV